MVKYIFKLKYSYMPDLTQKVDNEHGGVKLVYKVYRSFYIPIFKKHLTVFNLYLGTLTFLRPFKKNWDKKLYWLPRSYWGKITHPLTRLWVVLKEDNSFNHKKKIIPQATLVHQYVELFNAKFRSKELNNKLFNRSNKFQLLSIN